MIMFLFWCLPKLGYQEKKAHLIRTGSFAVILRHGYAQYACGHAKDILDFVPTTGCPLGGSFPSHALSWW